MHCINHYWYVHGCPDCRAMNRAVLPKDSPQPDSGTPKYMYLLNAFETASQSDKPAENGYAGKRAQLIAYIANSERELAAVQAQSAELKARMQWSFEQPDGSKLSIADMCNIVPELRTENAALKAERDQIEARTIERCKQALKECLGDGEYASVTVSRINITLDALTAKEPQK